MSRNSVGTYIQRELVKYAAAGFIAISIVGLGAAALLARMQAATNLVESASAVAEAFHNQIMEGDIRSAEPQIREVLRLKPAEVAKVLNSNGQKIYSPVGDDTSIQRCPVDGKVCFQGYFGQASVDYPIYFGSTSGAPFGFVHISKELALNWSFLITTFIVFAIGYCGLVFAFFRISKSVSSRLGQEISEWATRIENNPKDASPRSRVPFAELLPLKFALEGLNEQIENFEREAKDKIRLLILRGIAHDLLTPVAQLQLNLATLESQVPKGQYEELMADLRESLQRVVGIASQVKTLRSNSGPESTDITSIAANEVKALSESEMCVSRQIHLDFASEDKTLIAPFSQTEVSRIIFNLVQNAVDASKSGTKIKVSLSSSKNEGTLSVSDEGKGIEKSDQSKVFDPEFTLKPSSGTGLGLAIVKYICEKRSAKIDLKSEVNQGTTVKIQFPIAGGNYV